MTNNTSEFRSFGTPAAVVSQVQEAVVGKADIIEQIMMAILAKGHILIEDIPGTGKTTMALAFSRAMGLKQTEYSLPLTCFRQILPDLPFIRRRPGNSYTSRVL